MLLGGQWQPGEYYGPPVTTPIRPPGGLGRNSRGPLVLIKTRLKRMQYRPGLLDGFLAKTRLDLTIRDLDN